MDLPFFWISAAKLRAAPGLFIRFLCGRRVLAIERQFLADARHSALVAAVDCLDGAAAAATSRRERADYYNQLIATEFSAFAALRSLRRELAGAKGAEQAEPARIRAPLGDPGSDLPGAGSAPARASSAPEGSFSALERPA